VHYLTVITCDGYFGIGSIMSILTIVALSNTEYRSDRIGAVCQLYYGENKKVSCLSAVLWREQESELFVSCGENKIHVDETIIMSVVY
jgi:hypothetical protein